MSDQMTRREVVKALTVSLPVLPVLQGAAGHHSAAQAPKAAAPYALKLFNAEQNEAVAALAETIIPTTDTPGARAAKVHEFIDSVLSENQQQAKPFLAGLSWIQERCRQLHGKTFEQLESAQQVEMLSRISDDQKDIAAEDKPGAPFFRQLKVLACSGYYTSQVGLQQEIGYKGNRYLDDYKGCDDLGERLPGSGHRHKRA